MINKMNITFYLVIITIFNIQYNYLIYIYIYFRLEINFI